MARTGKKVVIHPCGGSLGEDGQGIGRSGHLVSCGDLGIMFDTGVRPGGSRSITGREGYNEHGAHSHSKTEQLGVFELPDLPAVPKIPEEFVFDSCDRAVAVADENSIPLCWPLEVIRYLVIVITHGHLDHVGALPYFTKRFPHVRIFMSRATYDIAEHWWRDTIKIAEEQGLRPLFDEMDILRVFEKVTFVEAGSRHDIFGATLEFFRAGHILGALCCRVGIPCGRRTVSIVHTGDMSVKPEEGVEGADLLGLSAAGPVDAVLIETTYGDREPTSKAELYRQIAQDVDECMRRGGKIFFGAFSLRAQGLYAAFRELGLVDRWPCWLDGAGAKMAAIYQKYGVPGFEDVDLHFVESWQQRRRIITDPGPAIIAAPNGMWFGGLAPWWFSQLAGDSRNIIGVASRYMDPCSPGARILEAKRGDLVSVPFHQKQLRVQLEAEVRTYGFTAHLERHEIVETLDLLSPETAFLIHGSRRAMERVRDETSMPSVMTEVGEAYEI